jgi:hypothetical protein
VEVDRLFLTESDADAVRHWALNMSVASAMKKDPAATRTSIQKEVNSMHDMKVFTPVDVATIPGALASSIIPSSIFCKEKYDPNGNFVKLKTRLVAGGHRQNRTLLEDWSSPTVAITSIFATAIIAAKQRRHVATMDIGSAYLNADMKGPPLYMRLDTIPTTEFVTQHPKYKHLVKNGKLTVRLNKALYGCVQSGKLWYDHFTDKMKNMDFVPNPIDPCVFNKTVNGKQCTVCLYVDDLMISCEDQGAVQAAIKTLQKSFKNCQIHHGKVHDYLGMTFDFKTPGSVKITMQSYVNDIVDNYVAPSARCKGVSTPADQDLFEIHPDSAILGDEDKERFHSMTARLLYLAKRVRPDILTPIAFLATRVTQPTAQDDKKLSRVIRYLKGSKDMHLTLSADNALGVVAYIDASYGPHSDGKSHSGSVITLGRGAVFVRSAKQRIVSKSSAEAELVALSDEASQVIWLRDFLTHQGHDIQAATIYQDNTAAVTLTNKGRATSDRTRHIAIRYFWVKDRADSGEVNLQYKSTHDMVADVNTKPLQGAAFIKFRDALLGRTVMT